MAAQHLDQTQPGDLLLFDRNYPSYVWLAQVMQRQLEFVGRCSRGSFKAAREMFAGHGPDSQLVTLRASGKQRRHALELGLPTQLTVRLVRVWLETGEMEVLVTSLQDETAYPTLDFGELYFLRWGIETFYDRLKNRLLLENFTGQTVKAVQQDFHATIYIAGLEMLLTQPANAQLAEKSKTNRYPQQVNHAVASPALRAGARVNAIKTNVIDLLHTDLDPDDLLEQLTALFLTKPVLVRKGRSVPRTRSRSRSLRFHKRAKKICF